jgi:hypothetical protein
MSIFADIPLRHVLPIPILLLAAACGDKSHAPALTKELMPQAAAGLVPGLATEADVSAAFGIAETLRDESLGGDADVDYGDKPAIRMTLEPRAPLVGGEAWLVPDADGTPRLQRIVLTLAAEAGACKWIEENVGKHPDASRSAGSNRKYGPQKGGVVYSGGSPDGKRPADIECLPSERDGVALESVTYGIVPAGEHSMRARPKQ